jgi:hypothetical protein
MTGVVCHCSAVGCAGTAFPAEPELAWPPSGVQQGALLHSWGHH